MWPWINHECLWTCVSLHIVWWWSVQFSSVTQSCPTLCDPMNCSTPGLPVRHQFPESTQTHVHRVSDAIQPSHPLLSPSSPALKLSQHQGLFQWVSSSHEVAKVLQAWASTSVLPMNTQDWSLLGCTGWISLQSKELSRVFSNTTVQKHQIFGTQLSKGLKVSRPMMSSVWEVYDALARPVDGILIRRPNHTDYNLILLS